MKRIAIIIEDSIYNRKGQMNAELNRISHLMQVTDYQIDVYSFQIYEGWLVRNLRHTQKVKRPDIINIDGVDIRLKWRSFSLIDHVLTSKLKMSAIVNKEWTLKYVDMFKDYDLVVANSRDSGYLAYKVHTQYNTPYCVTWHGSDIHTEPFTNESIMQKTRIVLDNAAMNFMVSKALLETSKKISESAKTMVLYNGVNKSFQRYADSDRECLRRVNGAEGKKIIAYAGNLIGIKNPQLLPEIFKVVNDRYEEKIEFWVMGDGKMSALVEDKCLEYNVPLKMWGNVDPTQMPSLLNCVDVLLLPSKNEGLPLIAAEALACGANAVGAKVGGIPEVMGEDNTFEHGDNFVIGIGGRILQMLYNSVEQPLSPLFRWENTAQLENSYYKKILK